MIKRKMAYTLAIMTLVLALVMASINLVAAHVPPWKIQTYSYIVAAPDHVGVNQRTYIVWWVVGMPSGPPATAAGVGGYRWVNVTIKVTKPNGLTEVIGPLVSDAVGGGFVAYTPDQIGTYKFELYFPEQIMSLNNPVTGVPGSPSPYVGDIYLSSTASTTLIVQEEPLPEPPEYPLPSEYWSRPIEGQNTAWASIASNYINPNGLAWFYGAQRFIPDAKAPDSPHIMWTKPLEDGGVVGGTYSIPGATYYTGLSYESRFSDPIILYGRLYYDTPLSDSPTGGPYVCVDLRTGETIWQRDDISPTFAQLYLYESMNQHGVIGDGYLWQVTGNKWDAYDPRTGKWLFSLKNVPTGANVYGNVYTENGAITRYVINYTARWLALWTTEALPSSPLVGAPGTTSAAYQYRPIGKEADMSKNYLWNVTIPNLPAGSRIYAAIPDDILFGGTSLQPPGVMFGLGTAPVFTLWALSLKPETRGQLLWIRNYTLTSLGLPSGNLTVLLGTGFPVDPETRVFVMNIKETMQWMGFSLDTGEKLWGPVGNPRAFNFYGCIGLGGSGQVGYIAYGNLYVAGYGGELFCYDLKTGNLKWKYNNTFSGLCTPWGNYPLFIGAIADGKVYVYSGEHSPNVPPYKGYKVRCIDAFTGEEIWTLLGWASVGAFADQGFPIADGFLVYLNVYDMQIYCIGKGPSETMVTASPKVSPVGSSILIEGTVMDISPGTKQHEQSMRFPHGLPAVSDEDQSAWMEYVYMQKPKPQSAKGVVVELYAIKEDGTSLKIGDAITDPLNGGVFKYLWTPPEKGTYIITAVFPGSKSYWGSYASTAVGITEAPPAAPTPATAEQAEKMQTTLQSAIEALQPWNIILTVLVIIAIVIGVVNLYALRKRK